MSCSMVVAVVLKYRTITGQLNEAQDDDTCHRTVLEVRNTIQRLKAEYHQERRRRNRSGAGGDCKFSYFDEMDAVLGARPMSSGHGSFSSIERPPEKKDVPSEHATDDDCAQSVSDSELEIGNISVELPQTPQPVKPTASPIPSSNCANLNKFRSKRRTRNDDIKQLMAGFEITASHTRTVRDRSTFMSCGHKVDSSERYARDRANRSQCEHDLTDR